MAINPGRIEYDVFLSHRGPDVKKGFVDYLYESLKAAGVPSFVDCKELEAGKKSWDAIASAIRHSKIHIAVFSKGYAESEWCLNELCEMLECSSNGSSTLFLPLFYNVAPSALRSPISEKSCYFAAFEKHQRNPDIKDSDIQGWKKALNQASLITGLTLDVDAHGSESHLKKLTEKKVLDVLNNSLLLEAAKYPVGVAEQLKQAMDLMRLDDEGKGGAVLTLGIFGMGGVGKSTLAKSIYNKIHRDFECICFMENVRSEAAKNPNGLRGLQERMLRILLKKEDVSVSSIAHGKEMMNTRLQGLKAMIILDDVDEREQLEALLPRLDCRLSPGSRIVITTRDEEIINLAPHAHQKIYMQGLSDPHAHTLFSLHAFLQEEPPTRELESLSKKVVAACQGLPLALEVLGAHLCNKGVSVWEQTVKVLQSQLRNMGVPAQREVTKCLRISYDSLDSVVEKPMFLDVACFLLGEHEDRAKRIWGESPTAGLCLENLGLKCLVKIDQDRRLTMHDLLRDMGREIVAESHRNIWQRSHLWNETDVRSVLRRKNGTCDVRGLGLILKSDEKWDTRSFAGMSGLELLKLSNGNLMGDFACISKELRWFQWRFCPLESVPDELGLENVAVVDLVGSSILSFSSEHISEALKELNLSECSNLKHLPEFINDSTSGLELLDLGGCVNLESIPDSVCRLSPSLRYININNCRKLTTLPESITDLPSLTTLLMNKCSGINRLPDAIGRLTALKEIGLEETPLRILPQSFGNLSNLVSLHLQKCFQLIELPSTIGDLSSLVSFHLNACFQLMEFPSTIGKLKKLTSFSIMSCPLISEIPQEASNLTNLVDLQISRCMSMSKLPDNIGNLKKLKAFSLLSNRKLRSLPQSISQLEALVSLDMGRCDITDGGLPNEFSTLSSLQRIHLHYNPHLSRLPENFHQLPKLQSLAVHHCENLREVPSLPPTLEELDMGDCPRLSTIPCLSSLTELQNLVLCNCIRLKELIGLEHLCHLNKLNISGCTSLLNTSGLENLTSLRFLYLAGSGVSLLQDIKPSIENAVSNLELVSLYGDEIPDVFRNCDTEARPVQQQEHANECCMEIVVQDVGTACKGVLFCFVSHDQGWSDYPWDHGRYTSSYTYVDAEVVDRGGCTKFSQSLFVNRHADWRNQLHISIFRASHPFVASLKSGDTIRVFARSLFQAWRITLSKGAVKLIYEEDEMEKALQELSRQPVERTDISCVYCGTLQCMPVELGFVGSSSASDHTSESLKELNISNRPDLKDLSEINDCLSGLEILNLAGCVNLERIPVCRLSPSLLRYLDISSCRKLKTLPEGIAHLRSLTTLLVRNCSGITNLPDAIGELPKLKSLAVHHCENLREVPCLPPTLEELDMGDCPRLSAILCLSSLTELQNLVLCNCIRLKKLIGLEHLCHLFKLNISGCTSLVNTSGLEKLTALRYLYLAGSGVSLLQDSKPWIENAVSNLELVSVYGDEIPDVFRNCDTEARPVQQQEHANECCMEIVVQDDVGTACKGVLFCFVSHDQGWSDYRWDHGRYSRSYTFAEVKVVEIGGGTKFSQSLFVNRHADKRNQLHISIFRASHPLVASLKSGDTIRVFARSLFQAWRITLSKGAVKLMYEEYEMEKALQELSRQA